MDLMYATMTCENNWLNNSKDLCYIDHGADDRANNPVHPSWSIWDGTMSCMASPFAEPNCFMGPIVGLCCRAELIVGLMVGLTTSPIPGWTILDSTMSCTACPFGMLQYPVLPVHLGWHNILFSWSIGDGTISSSASQFGMVQSPVQPL